MNKIEFKNKVNKFIESRNFKRIIYAFGIFFILFFVFQAGMIVGFKKASFRHDWGSNYEKNFGPYRSIPKFIKDNFSETPNAHGAIGKIIKVDLPDIVVLDKDQTEKSIVIDDNTTIIEMTDKVNKESLAVDKFVVVIGNPNSSGQIEAKLIRIIPSPEEMTGGNTPIINTN